jgi:hypothetical protein
VVTSCVVVVVVVVTGGGVSSAQPINANGINANIQMRILIIFPSVYVRFWLDGLVLFKFSKCFTSSLHRLEISASENLERC